MLSSALTTTYILNTYVVIYTKTRDTDTLQLYTNVIVNQRHSAIIHKYFSQPSALSKACGGDKLQLLVNSTQKYKRMTNTHMGRETTTKRTQQIYAYT